MGIPPFSAVIVASTCLVILGTACATTAPGNAEAAGMLAPAMLEPPPVYALLGFRSDLNLTTGQIADLDSIAEVAREQIAPMIRELEERGDRGRGGALRVDPDDPLLAEIRSARSNISSAVEGVLSEAQRATVCRLFERRGPGNQGGPGGNRPIRGGRAPMDGTMEPVTSVWNWCEAAPPEGAA